MALKPLSERFESNVNRDGPIPTHRPELGSCHVWTGARRVDGYGKIRHEGRDRKATHVALFLSIGRWPAQCALHHCDNPACVNPAHLFEGTRTENAADRDRKRRAAYGERHGISKLRDDDIRKILAKFESGLATRVELAREYGVDRSTIARVIRGERGETPPHRA